MSGAVFTLDLGPGQLPDRFLALRLRRLADGRLEAAGNGDRAAVFIGELAEAVRRRERPGEVDATAVLGSGAAGQVAAELAAAVEQARGTGDSATMRLVRVWTEWQEFTGKR